ncbi:ABC transporter substrate-binding protein [Halalkalicoccus sp. NIPERK01]|uniref:ABC transporter substrate-binding protein n=1 Tax=Halalkalicoccus sp. NIPERK01 TaxID=3053469 RepID=UPI00256EABEB|nr:ABC transporter substrate-binding protein [Halalkalicoccus sp. NIPERK01]MDL5361661.1 ABC transporter substrate-binding protein [Halalkalicoccus sp. NIPERK01]
MTGIGRPLGRRDLLAGIGAAAAASLGGCSALAKTPPGPRLRLATLYPPVTLDPIEAKYVGSKQVINRVFDGLYAYGEGGDVVPRIASGQPTVSADGLEVEVAIDERARFQNDSPITPEDVAYSFEAPVEEDAATEWTVDMIESVETVDDRTVRFRLGDPYPAFSHALTRPIVPKEDREADPERFATAPVGSGPFEVRKFTEERKAQLARWDDYWGESPPAIAQLTVVYVESPLTQMMGLRTGRSDAIEPIGPQVANDIRDVTNATVARRDGYRSLYLGVNLNTGPTTKPEVREAIDYCLDVDEAVREFVEPMGERVYSPLPRRVAEEWDLPVERWAEIPNPKNVERARDLFRQADETTGQLKILTSKDPIHKEFGEALAGGLRNAGHGALVASKPWKSYLETYVTGSKRDYSVFVGEITGTSDPDSFLYPTFHENMAGTTNGVFERDDEVMEPLSEARATTDRDRRRDLYETAITRLLSDRAVVPLCSLDNSFATTDRVRNFRVHPIPEVNPRLAGTDPVVEVRS